MRIFLFVLFLFFCAAGSGCSLQNPAFNPAPRQSSTYEYFGTVCSVLVYDQSKKPFPRARFENCWKEIDSLWRELDRACNPSYADSDVSRFNRALPGESVPVSALTAELFELSREMYCLTDGAFNPAVALLVDLYGFSPRFRSQANIPRPYDRPKNADGGFDPPEESYIRSFTELADFSLVRLSGNAKNGYSLEKPSLSRIIGDETYSMHIDFGGIAKGFAAELAAGVLERRGYRYGYVFAGNSSFRFLDNPSSGEFGEKTWEVAVENPQDSSLTYAVTGARAEGLSSSGMYLDFYRSSGGVFTHIIDPSTGLPSPGSVMSATVIGGNAAVNDALTTALMAMPLEKAVAFMNSALNDKKKRVLLIARRGTALYEYTNMAPGLYRVSAETGR